MRGTLDEFPLDRKHTRAGFTDLTESSLGQVNGIGVAASGAFVRHDHGNGVAICRVGDEHRLSANVLVKQCRIFDESEFHGGRLSKEHSPMAQIMSES